MTVTVDDIKNSLRIDLTDDDALIQNYIDVARSYVADAVDSTQNYTQLEAYPQFDFAVSLLTQFWYSNRDTDMKETPYQVVSMIQQLRGKINDN
ncbi:head-tail connector protein [Pediococcus ethanolidurans]|uniref:head-tail connector protein n=1 Tax=Pediococcus ethanolidurans TaxID=319653 RepID=UPI0021AAC7BE|nr:head-tail connector protein [Pediococcus ethanolidurans]MCT4397315.1 phage gp6-like head-tail connector protein [Pediococcus ethanolidurans]MCV3321531.1 head-tail connector protein [Pediococcus ethanolidurans]